MSGIGHSTYDVLRDEVEFSLFFTHHEAAAIEAAPTQLVKEHFGTQKTQ